MNYENERVSNVAEAAMRKAENAEANAAFVRQMLEEIRRDNDESATVGGDYIVDVRFDMPHVTVWWSDGRTSEAEIEGESDEKVVFLLAILNKYQEKIDDAINRWCGEDDYNEGYNQGYDDGFMDGLRQARGDAYKEWR